MNDIGIQITDSHLWQEEGQLDISAMRYIFRSDTSEEMPMLQERLDCLREAGNVLYEKYACAFSNCVAAANGSATSLVNILVRDFPCLRDERIFEGAAVRLHKRAQILVADIWACFNGQAYGAFEDMSSITMFSDYRIPQILNSMGVLLYSPSLEARISRKEELQSGENCETEIRGCSVWAVEMIRQEIIASHPDDHAGINAALIDNFLYDTLKEREASGEIRDIMPHHRTRSVWY